MRKIILIFFLLFIFQICFAQLSPYFSFKKVPSGAMIGVEVFDQKTNQILLPKNYRYEWIISEISLIPQETFANNVFIFFENYLNSLSLRLKVSRFLGKESYNFDTNLNLPSPQVKIVRKHQDILMPLLGKVTKNDYLVAMVKDFSSKDLQYYWDFNGSFISQDKEIPVYLLKGTAGILRLRVFGFSPRENAVDVQSIVIE